MSTVSWNARDQLGRVIEVTSDTIADVPSPGPETLAVGGEQTVRLLGPFTYNHDDPEPWVALVALDQGATVLAAWPEILESFDGGDTSIELYAGDPDGSPVMIGQWFADQVLGDADVAKGATVSPTSSIGTYASQSPRPIRLLSAGASLILSFNEGASPPSQGAAVVYALIAEPAA